MPQTSLILAVISIQAVQGAEDNETETIQNRGNTSLTMLKKIFILLSMLLIIGNINVFGALSDNLAVCYPFDANANDYFGVWNATSNTADLDTTTKKLGAGSMDCEASNSDRITIGGWGTIVDLEHNWTVCYWAMSETTTGYQSTWGDSSNGIQQNYDGTAGSLISFYSDVINIAGSTADAGNWNLICTDYTATNDTAYIYKNNTLIISGSGVNADTGLTIDICARNGGTNYYDGRIDEFMVFNKNLNTSEKTEIYNSGTGKTCSDIMYTTPTYTLTGNITYNNTIITNTNISLINDTSNTVINTALVNATGGFSFSLLSNATYYLLRANYRNSTVAYTGSKYQYINSANVTNFSIDMFGSIASTIIYPSCFVFSSGCYASSTLTSNNCALVSR